jgi:hypothetical protein
MVPVADARISGTPTRPMAGMRRVTSRDPEHELAEEQGVDAGDETGSEQEGPLRHRHERLCEDASASARVPVAPVAPVALASAIRYAPDGTTPAPPPSASRFDYPDDGNGVIMGKLRHAISLCSRVR